MTGGGEIPTNTPMASRYVKGVIGLSIPLLLWAVPLGGGLSDQGQRGLALTVFAILYWVLEPIPLEWTSLLLMLLTPLFGVTGVATALSGFTTDAFWLVLASFLLGEGVLQSGLGKRLALLSLKILGTRYPAALIGLLVAGLTLGFLVPSGVGRVSLILPIAIAIAVAFGFPPGSAGMAGLTMAATFGAVFPPYAIMTSNIPNLVLLGAAQLSAGIHLSYGQWLLMLGPPLGLLKLFLSFVVIRLLFWPTTQAASEEALERAWKGLGPVVTKEKQILWIGGLVLLFWATDALHGIRPSWVGMGGVLALFLPGIQILDRKALGKSLNYPILLYCAGILSLGAISRQSGIAEWIGKLVFELMPGRGAGLHLLLIVIAVLSTGLSVLLTTPVLPAVLTPILVSYTEGTGLPLLPILLIQVIGAGTPLFPYQVPPVALSLGFQTFTHVEAVKAMLLLALSSLLLILPATLLYWSLLGLLP